MVVLLNLESLYESLYDALNQVRFCMHAIFMAKTDNCFINSQVAW